MDYLKEADELVKQMTLDEKIHMITGNDFWHTYGIERLGIPSIMVTDGPNGLRKQYAESDMLGINKSVPATCMPTSCTTACSFDRSLLNEIGEALGEECHKEQVSVILGPGVNIKRSPLCGRNFEYYSEDPLLAGEMGASLINGVQSKDVGTSLKHFAGNSQETRRLLSDSIIDKRALNEIYLTNFETAVKKGKPWTVMYAYNQVNGKYCYRNDYLLKDTLREKWGFTGVTVSDWGACADATDAIKNEANLEMPGPCGVTRDRIKGAITSGDLTEEQLDKNVRQIVALVLKSKKNIENQACVCDMMKHHDVAVKAASDSMVLLKNNDNILPLKKDASIAIIGKFAKQARFQGAGSSQVNAYKIDEAYDVFKCRGCNVFYADGYNDEATAPDETLIQQASNVARGKDAAIVFIGLPASFESEGYDRESMKIPEAHERLVREVSKVNSNVIVVLMCGSPVEVNFDSDAKAILLAYLGGQGVGAAVYNVVFGDVCPSGKLAETWPLKCEDNPSSKYYIGGRATVEYRESIFVGYRYYETAKKPVKYPFGYGLSYSNFEYSNLKIDKTDINENDTVNVSFDIKNTGDRKAKESAQLYISHKNEKVYMPALELRGFDKVELEPGETKSINIELSKRAFSYYNVVIDDWYADSGIYTVSIGKSCEDIVLTGEIKLTATKEEAQPDYRESAPVYYNLKNEALTVSAAEFTAVYGETLPEMNPVIGRPFGIHSSIADLKACGFGKVVNGLMDVVSITMKKKNPGLGLMIAAMVKDMPLSAIGAYMGDKMNLERLNGLIDFLNGNKIVGIKKIINK